MNELIGKGQKRVQSTDKCHPEQGMHSQEQTSRTTTVSTDYANRDVDGDSMADWVDRIGRVRHGLDPCASRLETCN